MSVDALWSDYQRRRRAWDIERDPGEIAAVVDAYRAWAEVFAPGHAAEFTALTARILHREAFVAEHRWRA